MVTTKHQPTVAAPEWTETYTDHTRALVDLAISLLREIEHENEQEHAGIASQAVPVKDLILDLVYQRPLPAKQLEGLAELFGTFHKLTVEMAAHQYGVASLLPGNLCDLYATKGDALFAGCDFEVIITRDGKPYDPGANEAGK